MRRSSTYRHANPTYLQMGAARHQHEHVRNRSVFQSARRFLKVGADTRDVSVLRLLQRGHMSCCSCACACVHLQGEQRFAHEAAADGRRRPQGELQCG